MRTSQLKQLLADAARFAPGEDLVVVGSQAILGSMKDTDLPDATTMSREADVYVVNDPDESMTTTLDRIFGELAEYDAKHGVYLQGVDATTARLPASWRSRATGWPLPGGGVAYFPDPHDLAVSKLAADRTKDREFVQSLLDVGLLDARTLLARIGEVQLAPIIRRRVTRFVRQQTEHD